MSLTWRQIEANAVRFADAWADARYERGETQTFYNEFFEVFGISRRSVARYEEHVRLAGGGGGFVDLLWPGVLIVEQKSRGRDLAIAARQAGDYFDALPEAKKPRFQLVCDFQTFRLVDRDARDEIEFVLADLPKHVRRFSFLLGKQSPKNRVQEQLSLDAAKHIIAIHDDLKASRYPNRDMETMLTRLVYCLFADSAGVFRTRGGFADLIEASVEAGEDLGQLLSMAFQVLGQPLESRQQNLRAELADLPYVNGGIFKRPIAIPTISNAARTQVLRALRFDWSSISPALFGSLYQSVLDPKERRHLGAYATTETNILKVLDGLLFDKLKAELQALCEPGARRREQLEAFRGRLRRIRCFDPACGCGNFLAIAYRELRKIELAAMRQLDLLGELGDPEARQPWVSLSQLYGIEKQDYSARIAEASLWICDHLANNEASDALRIDYSRVPLANGPNIIIDDALAVNWKDLVAPSQDVYVFGNPPYKGPKKQTDAERATIRELAALPRGGGTLDYACGWIIKACEYAEAGAGVGLVSVNSIAQGEQAGQLWPTVFDRFGLSIVFAHQPFKWFADIASSANVYVVVVGLGLPTSPPTPRFLHVYDDPAGSGVAVPCAAISPYLIVGDELEEPTIVVQEEKHPINGLRKLETGTKPIDGGYYILTEEERVSLLREEPASAAFMHPFVGGDEFINGTTRYLLVLEKASPKQLRNMAAIRVLVEKVARYRNAEIPRKDGSSRLNKPTEKALVANPLRFHLRKFPSGPFLVIPEVTSERRRYVPIGWLQPPAIPSNLVKFLENASLAEFALLTSAMHMAWLRTVGGRLEGRFRYSIGVVYNTFPMPKMRDDARLRLLGQGIIDVRERLHAAGCSLADMYDAVVMPHELQKAHQNVDDEVDRQYLGHPARDESERVIHLLNAYRALRASDDNDRP
jgi:hypothetical protein